MVVERECVSSSDDGWHEVSGTSEANTATTHRCIDEVLMSDVFNDSPTQSPHSAGQVRCKRKEMLINTIETATSTADSALIAGETLDFTME